MGIAGDAPPDAFLNDRNGGPLSGDDFRSVPCGRCPGCASAQERGEYRSASFPGFLDQQPEVFGVYESREHMRQ